MSVGPWRQVTSTRAMHKPRIGRRPANGPIPFRLVQEREVLESRVAPSTRDIWPGLRARLLASRPVVGERVHPHLTDAKGKPLREPVFGAPTFRNVIEDGVLQ